jgi:uncharacterized protein YraI
MATATSRTTKRLLMLGLGVVCLALILTILFESVAVQTQAVFAQSAQYGVVSSNVLNLRSGPGTNYTVVGRLRRGDRVEILDRQPGWLLIKAPAVNGGSAWVAARYVLLEGSPAAPATPSPASTAATGWQVAAPQQIDYRDELFTWRWDGANAMQGQDWYFDIQIFHATDRNPYKIIVAEPQDTTVVNGLYRFTRRARAECESYWVVQVAVRSNGRFAGWVSPKSTRQPIGGACARPTENPTEVQPAPTDDGGGNGCQGADCAAIAPRFPIGPAAG